MCIYLDDDLNQVDEKKYWENYHTVWSNAQSNVNFNFRNWMFNFTGI
jgi:hypothetical protein